MLKRVTTEKYPLAAKRPRVSVPSQVKVFVRVRPFNVREQQTSSRTPGVSTPSPSDMALTAAEKQRRYREKRKVDPKREAAYREKERERSVVSVADESSVVFDPEEEEEPFFYRGIVQKGRDITKRAHKNLHFHFDRVYGEDSSNLEVFQGSTKDLVSSVFEGYNCSVFAYGATGAGKTFTMLGTEEQPGIAYLMIVELLDFIQRSPQLKVTLGVSYLEVYNENVKDLLNPGSAVLHLREDGPGRITVSGLKVKQINQSEELFSLLIEGNRNRTQHPTDSNAESSRSHAVFQVHARVAAGGLVKISKLSMIDLAGSERASATGCSGLRFKEGANINKSLLALGNCINALADGLSHVPYRDSKLTRLLKDSLGGNCRTVMIANVSPSSSAYEDTYNTLKYATRTKCIKSVISKNIMNDSISLPQYKKMVQEANDKIKLLEEKIKEMAGGSFPDLGPWEERIRALYETRRSLYREYLSLENQVKLNDFRIQLKEQAMALSDPALSASSNPPVTDRVECGISQLKGRSECIRSRLREFGPAQEANRSAIASLETDIAAQPPNLASLLRSIVEKYKHSVELEESKIRMSYLEKIINLRARNNSGLLGTLQKALPLLTEEHEILRGNGWANNQLNSKYEETQKSVAGVKGVSWEEEEETELADSPELVEHRLRSIEEIEADLSKSNDALNTTVTLGPAPATIYPLRQNNHIANVPRPTVPTATKWTAVSRTPGGPATSRGPLQKVVAAKENNFAISRRALPQLTPTVKFKTGGCGGGGGGGNGSVLVRPTPVRAHPYRRTPARPRQLKPVTATPAPASKPTALVK